MKINYRVQGFLSNRRERSAQVINSRELEGVFRGHKLDEIEIQATIKSQEELDYFVNFLLESRPCFGNSNKL